MAKTENAAGLPPRVKRILWMMLVAAMILVVVLIVRYVFRYMKYDAYKEIIQPPVSYDEGSAFTPLKDELKAVKGFVPAAENEKMILYFNQKTAEVALYDKESGITVYSNPQDADKDPVARAGNLENLKSQFILSYLDGNAKEGTAWNSYAKSVESGQMSCEKIENGVRVIYNLSNEKLLLVPDVLTQEWYEMFINAGKKQAKKSYVLNDEMGLYELKTQGVTARNRQQIDADAREAGFTMADYEQMQALLPPAEDAEGQTETLSFTVTLDWILTPDGIEVTIPYEGLGEFGNGKIRAIQLLPMFGAAGADETGEIVIPEGSGALIRFNNGKSASAQYNKNIYDLDPVDSDLTALQNQQTVRLPIIGICRENYSLLATCERGASLAAIVADVAGRNNSYNYAYFTFSLRRTDTLTISGESVIVAEEDLYPVDLRVHYEIIPKDAGGYVDIARTYRESLIESGALERETNAAGDIPFYCDVIGGVKETAHIAGIQYLRLLPMTTFAEAGEMMDELGKMGITNRRMNLQGWMNGGYYHDPVRKTKVIGKLGGEKGLALLIEKENLSGGKVYPDAAIQQVSDIAKGFTAGGEASRYYAQGYVVNLARVSPVSLRRTDTMGYKELGYKLLSPKFLPRYAKALSEEAEELQLTALSLRDLGNDLHADKRRTEVINREYALDLVKDAFQTLSANGRDILVTGGNDYCFPYVSDVIGAPLSATSYPILDEQIPLWEMIVHGSVSYAGNPINMTQSEDRRVDLLRFIDYGASVRYTFTWRDAAEMKYTGLNSSYATTFSSWKEQAAEDYAFVNGALKYVSGAAMINHARLSDTLTRSDYSNGISIYVNTGDAFASADGYTVAPYSYLVTGGEAQ